MKTVTFKFTPNQKVETRFGETGFVSMCAIDDDELITYYIDLPGGKGSWEKESDLKEAK